MLVPDYWPAGFASDEGAGSVVLPAGSVADRAIEADFVPAREADWQTYPIEEHTRYGESVASAGSVDGHYGDDILVGAPKDETLGGGGVVYLFLSTGGGLNTTAAWEKSEGLGGASFGSAVAGAGDVNDDGYDDAIIGAVDYKAELIINDVPKEVKAGGAFVYLGDPGTGLSPSHTWSYTGTVREGQFGYAVAGAGDVNDDEYDDIVVGARWYSDQPDIYPTKHSGAIYVFYGSESGPSAEPDWFIFSDQAGAWFGASVSAAGDVSGDGIDDLIVGAPGFLNPETGVREGAAMLFLGGDPPPDDVADAAWIVYGWQEGAGFGTDVAGAGDVNGDGHPDVVVSAPWYHRPSDDVEAGAAFVYCGNDSGLGSDPCWQAYGTQPATQFGASAGGAGDVNDDGYDDVIVGAPYYTPDPVAGFEGGAFLYFGSATGLAPWAGWKAGGDKSRTDFGWAVGSAGDVNSDGKDGVVIGAPQYYIDGTAYGAAFVFYSDLEPGELYRTYLPLVVRNSN